MHVISFLKIDGLFVKALEADAPEASPRVVARDARVLDSNPAARDRGVFPGMALSEAKAILGGSGAYTEWEAEPYRALEAAWLDVCAEHSDAVEPVDQHEAFVDLSEHPDPRDMARRLVAAIEARVGLPVSAGLAGCRWLAQVAADVRGETDPLEYPTRFVAPLPTSVLPIHPEHRERLVLLGYRTVGEVARIELETLRRQFGECAIAIKRAALGAGDAYVDAAYPPECAASRFTYESSPDTLEAFHNGLIALAKSLGAKLVERDAYGEVLEVALEHEDGTVSHVSRKFARPIASPGSLWPTLRSLLAETPENPVVGVRARMPGLRKARRVQLGLNGVASKTERDAGAVAAVEHVRAAFGDGRIVLGADLEEPRWKRVRAAWRSANGWAWT